MRRRIEIVGNRLGESAAAGLHSSDAGRRQSGLGNGLAFRGKSSVQKLQPLLWHLHHVAKMPAMKRKLNEHDVPEESSASSAEEPTFASLGLEPRLLRGIRDQV